MAGHIFCELLLFVIVVGLFFVLEFISFFYYDYLVVDLYRFIFNGKLNFFYMSYIYLVSLSRAQIKYHFFSSFFSFIELRSKQRVYVFVTFKHNVVCVFFLNIFQTYFSFISVSRSFSEKCLKRKETSIRNIIWKKKIMLKCEKNGKRRETVLLMCWYYCCVIFLRFVFHVYITL